MRPYKHRGHRGFKLFTLAGSAVVAVLAACATDSVRECRVGADCASGVCGPDGQCVIGTTEPPAEAGGDGNVVKDDSSIPKDAGGDVALPGCTANKDGTITREEVPIAAGLHATYQIGVNETVSTAGTPGANGRRIWDFSAKLASDVGVLVETQALTGKWYAPDFVGATYASKLSQSTDLLGVFETTPATLLLRGVVSPTDAAATKTELTNTPAVAVLTFPLKVGATWTTSTKVGGTAQGVSFFGATYDEKYENKVDFAGDLKTPLGTFDVLRVQVLLTRTNVPLTANKTIRTFAFVTECYGTIATVTSGDNETEVEFTKAAEIRRISP